MTKTCRTTRPLHRIIFYTSWCKYSLNTKNVVQSIGAVFVLGWHLVNIWTVLELCCSTTHKQSSIKIRQIMRSKLTGVCHGEAAARVHHVHLWHQFGDVLVLSQSKTKHLILMGTSGEKASCWVHRHQILLLYLTVVSWCFTNFESKFRHSQC